MTQLEDIRIHKAVIQYIIDNGGIPDVDSFWNRSLPNWGNSSLDNLQFNSTIPTPSAQDLIDIWDANVIIENNNIAINNAKKAIEEGAIDKASSIPNWATWTETEALNWHDTNIASQLPVSNLTEANAVLQLLETENRALVRMVLALRNKAFPSLEGN